MQGRRGCFAVSVGVCARKAGFVYPHRVVIEAAVSTDGSAASISWCARLSRTCRSYAIGDMPI